MNNQPVCTRRQSDPKGIKWSVRFDSPYKLLTSFQGQKKYKKAPVRGIGAFCHLEWAIGPSEGRELP